VKLLHLVGWIIWIVWWCTDLRTSNEIYCLCYLAIMMIMVIKLKLYAFSVLWLGCQINVSAVLPSNNICTSGALWYERLFDRPAVKTEIGHIPRRISKLRPSAPLNHLYFRVDITHIISWNWCRSDVVLKYSLKIRTWIQSFFYISLHVLSCIES
jgi:hypothetical protein